jgi:hypothetical protein
MQKFGMRGQRPELKEFVVEASKALAHLDADRLEELALSCQALNRALVPVDADQRAALAAQARNALGEMAVFARVLEATRANLNVMKRLQELRAGRLEYGQLPAAADRAWARTESRHGDN